MNNIDIKLPDGVITASVTPLTSQYQIDHNALAAHCRWLLANGNNGICLMGTTGEANSFSVDERIEALESVVKAGIPCEKLIVGTGCCALTDTIRLTRHATSLGVGGVLVLPPFYYKQVNENGLVEYFTSLINAIRSENLRIYLYHFPKMTGVPFTVSLVKRLVMKYPDIIVGMKDSSGEWENMKAICEGLPGFKIYAGTEKYLLDILRIGGAGCISATTNLTGNLAAKVYANKNRSEAACLQEKLTQARMAFEGWSFISGVKHLLAHRQPHVEWLNIRPPNSKLTPTEAAELESRLSGISM